MLALTVPPQFLIIPDLFFVHVNSVKESKRLNVYGMKARFLTIRELEMQTRGRRCYIFYQMFESRYTPVHYK